MLVSLQSREEGEERRRRLTFLRARACRPPSHINVMVRKKHLGMSAVSYAIAD